jgi:tetratricopeptide (TPR) repeat protein
MSTPADGEYSLGASGRAEPDSPAVARDESLVLRAVARLQAEAESDRPAAARDSEVAAPPPLTTLQNAVLAAGVVLVIAIWIAGGWAFLQSFRNPVPTQLAPSAAQKPAPSVAESPPLVAEKSAAATDKPSAVTEPAEPTAPAVVITNDLPKPAEPQPFPQSQSSPPSRAAAPPSVNPPAAVDDEAVDPAARELISRGWALSSLPYTAARWQEARRDFERALEVDPRSREARIGLASILSNKLADGWSPVLQEDMPHAEQLLLEAIDDGDVSKRAAAHFTLGVLRQMQNRLPEAQAEFETASSLGRNEPRTYLHLGETLLYLGQPEAAIPPLEEAIRLGPNDPNVVTSYWALGTCQLLSARVDQAIDLLQTARAADPRAWVPHFYLAGAYALKGDLDKARSAFAEAIRLKPAMKSLARMRVENPWLSNQQYWALQERTLNIGLRRVGFPDQ